VAFKKKALIFGFFLVLSTALWFMNALGDYYTTEIRFPVRYKNFPNQKLQIGNPPENLTIRVRARGSIILRNRIGARYTPISFNVNSFTMNRLAGRDSAAYFLQTIYTREYIANQLSSEFEIISISPDTLFFRFASMKSKRVPVRAGFTYKLDRQLILKSPPALSPDSVMVSGPDYIVDTLRFIGTENTDLGIISRNTENTVGLDTLKYINTKTREINVMFDVEKFTEKTVQVPITAVNIPSNLKLQTFPHNIQVTCQVGLSNYDKLQANYFRAQVNYNEIIQTKPARIKVDLVNSPPFVQAVDFNPRTVEYLIER